MPDTRLDPGKLGGEIRDPVAGAAHEDRHADGHATLTGGAHPGPHQVAQHLRLVGVRHDHHVIFGTDEALGALEVVGGGAIDMSPDPGRTHEADRLHVRVGE
ncbi:hypothetical protein D3C72_2099080 [compost metagenome]